MRKAIVFLVLVTCGCKTESKTENPPLRGSSSAVIPRIMNDTSHSTRTYVGELSGTDSLIALVTDGKQCTALVSSGERSWKSHSAWFLGEVREEQFRAVTETQQELMGKFGESEASGSLRTPDGSETTWTARRAKQGGPAGLYMAVHEEAFTGVIVAENGRVQGLSYSTATGKVSKVQLEKALTGGGRESVMVEDSARSVSVARISSPLDIGEGTKRLFDGVARAVAAVFFLAPWPPLPVDFFTDGRQKLVIFVHGITPPSTPGDPGRIPSPPDDPGTGLEKNSLAFARGYWPYDFVRAVLGAEEGLYTFDQASVNSETWSPSHMEAPSSPPGLPPCIRISDDLNDPDNVLHFCAPRSDWQNASLIALLTYRRGEVDLVTQTKATIAQIYDFYTRHFSIEQPQIVIVGHSMGGLVARMLCCNPDAPIASGSNDTLEELNPSERDQADFIRDRTLYIVTLATPHLGSAIPDYMTPVDQMLPSPMRGWFPFDIYLKSAQRPGMYDLRSSYWSRENAGALRLENTKRTDGTAIPIHMFGGRSAAGGFNRTLDLVYNVTEIAATDGRSRYEAIGLMALEDALTRVQVGGVPWGLTSDPQLDQVSHITTGAYLAAKVQEIPPGPLRILGEQAIGNGRDALLGFLGLPVPTAEQEDAVADYADAYYEYGVGEGNPPLANLYLDQPYRLGITMVPGPPTGFCGHPIMKHPYHVVWGRQVPCLDPAFEHEEGDEHTPGICIHPLKLHPDGDPGPEVPHFDLVGLGGTLPDGETDNDGMVSIASSLAWGLGWDHANGGAVYRHPEDGPWKLTNHGSIKASIALGSWLHKELLTRAGPRPDPGPISVW